MATIKNIVYKAAKKLAVTNDLDITPEELASLALFKVMNMPYFENCNDFLNLHYNVFEEISMGNMPLNNLKGYSNGNLESFVVMMNLKETVDSKIDPNNLILKKVDHDILKQFVSLLNNSESLFEVADKIAEIEKKSPLFLNKVMNMASMDDAKGNKRNKLLKALNQVTPYEKGETSQEYFFEQQTKINNYRGERHYNDLKDIAFNTHNMKDLSKKPLNEILEDITQRDLDSLTGVPDLKKEDLKTFHKTHPEEYAISMYKVFKDFPEQRQRTAQAFNINLFASEVKAFNKKVKKIFENKTAEQLMAQYDEYLQPIMKLVEKNYPQVMKDVKDTPCEIKTFIYNSSAEKDKVIDKEHPLEIYQDDYMRMNYPSVRGLTFYKNFWNSNNGIYVSANNGLEDVVSGEGDFRTELSTAGHRMMFDNVRIWRVYEAGRDSSLEDKQAIIEAYVKIAVEKNMPFVHDIIERDHDGQSKFNDDLRIAINNLKEKYPNVIFVNDGMSKNDKERLTNDIKADLLMTMVNNKIPYDQMLKVDKHIEAFFKTPAFLDLAKLDYFERKRNPLIQEATDNALAVLNKNKRKVAP